MLGGTVNKIINTQFKWSGAEQGMTNMQKLSVSASAIGAAVAAAGMALWRLAEQTCSYSKPAKDCFSLLTI